MRAAQDEEPETAAIVPKQDDIFAQDSPAQRPILDFITQGDRMPITAQHFSGRRTRTDPRVEIIFCNGQHRSPSPILKHYSSAPISCMLASKVILWFWPGSLRTQIGSSPRLTASIDSSIIVRSMMTPSSDAPRCSRERL